MKKAVVLLSGGLDSAVTLYYARYKGYSPLALIFNYRQRHKKEIDCAGKIAAINRIDCRLVDIDISWVNSAIAGSKVRVPKKRALSSKNIPVTYVAGRNIIFLSYAFSLAESVGASRVFIGAHVQDYSGYPDCRPEFIAKFQAAARAGMRRKDIVVNAPLINKDKTQIIRLGLRLGVPFEYTWSCYQGAKRPCLKCDSCRFRMEGFKRLGLTDPLIKRQ